MIGLDQLKPLVRERCGVDRDLRAHVPRRVRKRFARCDAFQIPARTSAERPTGGGEHEGVDLVGRPAFEALERPRVLAVDGNETPSPALLRVEGKSSGRYEALLVREREIDAALERPQRCGQTGEADHGVQDEIRCGPVEQLGQVAADLRQRREPVDRLRARGSGAELQLGVVVDDLQRLASFDRAHSVPFLRSSAMNSLVRIDSAWMSGVRRRRTTRPNFLCSRV